MSQNSLRNSFTLKMYRKYISTREQKYTFSWAYFRPLKKKKKIEKSIIVLFCLYKLSKLMRFRLLVWPRWVRACLALRSRSARLQYDRSLRWVWRSVLCVALCAVILVLRNGSRRLRGVIPSSETAWASWDCLKDKIRWEARLASREMAQWIRAIATLAEDPLWFPAPTCGSPSVNSCSWGSNALSWPPLALYTQCT